MADASGNVVHFGKHLKKHLEDHDQSECDRRKKRLRMGVEIVRLTSPQPNPTGDPNTRAYWGAVDGKGYLVLVDEDGEIDDVYDLFRNRKYNKKSAGRGQPPDATGLRTSAQKQSHNPQSGSADGPDAPSRT